jgi:DNA-binding GntR family transcriptional regulator
MSNPAGSARIRQQLLPALRESILLGSMKPGSKIIESRVAATLGVSRTPLREALLHLEREGLVRSDLRRGFTVEPLSARDVRETYPLLAALECFAVRSSGEFIPPLLPSLEQLNEKFRRARSPKQALDLDTQWHDRLVSPSRNDRLRSLLVSLRLAIRRYEHLYMSDASMIPASADQHDAILEAFRKGAIDLALKAIELNYTLGMHVLLRKMGEE